MKRNSYTDRDIELERKRWAVNEWGTEFCNGVLNKIVFSLKILHVRSINQIDVDQKVPYSAYHKYYQACREFTTRFVRYRCGYICIFCEKLWFREDLREPLDPHHEILQIILPDIFIENILACNTYFSTLNKKIIRII